MAIGKVRTPGLNGHGIGPTPQYSFFGPVRPRESCSVTTCVGSGWFTLKKLPRCTPRTCKPLMLTVVSGSGLNSTARLACTPYGFLWFWSKRTTPEGPKNPQVEIGLQPGSGFVNMAVVLSGYAPSFTSPCNAIEVIAASWLLAGQQRRGNDAVEQSKTSAPQHVAPGTKVVRNAGAGINILPLRVQHIRRPRFPFPAKTCIKREPGGGAPLILNVETGVLVVQLAQRAIAY